MKERSDRGALVNWTTAALCTVVMMAFVTSAWAQTSWFVEMAPVDTAAEGGAEIPAETKLDEIIVTAQRKSTDLSKTPVAVSVLSSEALQQQQIVSQADLQSAVPGLTVRASNNSDRLNYAIRGQSLDAFSGSSPAVLPYVNEIQIGGSGGATSFYDLDSVQVLKGPQGTLFGRNSTGGAVLFTTTKPTNESDGYLSAGAGNYHTQQYEGALNVPIVADHLSIRLAGYYERQRGFEYNLYNDTTVGDVLRASGRLSVNLKVSDDLQSTLVTEYFHSGGESLGDSLYSLNPKSPIPSPVFASPAADAVFGPGAWASFLSAHPHAPPEGLAAFLPVQLARGPFLIDSNGSNAYQANNFTLSDITTWQVGENTQIKNIVGYNSLRDRSHSDADGSPYPILDNGSVIGGPPSSGNPTDTKQYSEELQVGGKALQDELNYVSGFYGSYDRSDQEYTNIILNLDPFFPNPPDIHHGLTQTQNYAGYGQGTFNLADWTGVSGLGATTGVRYTHEKTSGQILPGDALYDTPDSATYQKRQETVDNNVSWQFGIQEQINAETLFYVTTRRSYRDGGFNILQAPFVGLGAEGGNRFLPETATDVELGYKFQGAILGIPGRFNFAVYDTAIKDQQRVTYAIVADALASVTVNVPYTRVAGFESDGQIALTSWLKIGAAANYINAKFTNNVTAVVGQETAYGPYPDAPRWSGSVFMDASAPLANELVATLHAELYDQTGTYFSPTYNTVNPGTSIPGYAQTNFRLAVENTQRGWSVSANLKNAFNRVYYVGGFALGNVTGTNAVVPGAPRTFLVQARFKF